MFLFGANQMRGGLGRVCATGMYRSIEHVEFPKFQTGIFVEWKAPSVMINQYFSMSRVCADFNERSLFTLSKMYISTTMHKKLITNLFLFSRKQLSIWRYNVDGRYPN